MTFAPTLFVYVKIPIVADLVDQVRQRADKIDQILREKGIGSVIGWGDSLGDRQPNGSRVVAFHRIDIEVNDLPATRFALQAALPLLDVSRGAEIHYTIEGKALMDVYSISGWLSSQYRFSSGVSVTTKDRCPVLGKDMTRLAGSRGPNKTVNFGNHSD